MISLQVKLVFATKLFMMCCLLKSRFVSPAACSRLALSPAVVLSSSKFLLVFVKGSWRCNFPPNKHGHISIVELRTDVHVRTDRRK